VKQSLIACLFLAACSASPAVPEAVPETGASASADGLTVANDDLSLKNRGHYELWENIGDDGRMCDLELTGTRTIGGYVVEATPDCLAGIRLEGLSTWFVSEADGYLVMTDAARQPLIRLRPDSNGVYFGNNEFYAVRQN